MAIDFGLSTLSRGVLVSREAYLSVAQAAERAGFGFLSVNDHIIVPGTLGSAYPYTQGGAWAAAEHGHCFDQLATLAFLAGCTSRLRLLTSVMVVPHRPAISTAKMLATIDVLSGGRLILGVGAGWMKEEFGLLGAPFEERGAATDEYLEAFKALWTQERPSYSGEHVRFADVHLRAQAAAEAASAHLGRRREPGRAATYGQARRCLVSRQQQPDQAARYPGAARRRPSAGCSRMAEAAGRDPASIAVSLIVQNPFEWAAQKIQDGSARRLFTGASADMAADAAALEALGVRHVALRLGGAIAGGVARAHRPLRPRGDRETELVGVMSRAVLVAPWIVPGVSWDPQSDAEFRSPG